MKPIVILAVATILLGSPATAQPGRTRQLYLPPLAGFGPPQGQRAGQSQMIEMVPRGQSLQRYSKIVTVTTFPARPGISADQLLRAFTQRYVAGCPRAQVRPIDLGGGNRGARIDCTRHPRTGRPETTFVRAAVGQPAVAIASYMTTYFTMPGEATVARDFLGRIGFR